MNLVVESSPFGRIAIPPGLPDGMALFYTTVDFDGALDRDRAAALMSYVDERFGIGASLSTCHQIHSADARRVDGGREWSEQPQCDALYGRGNGVALGIKVADCLPVTLYDRDGSVIANIHAGWRGSAGRIVARTIDAARSDAGFDTRSAYAWLGPTIRQCCFEVGDEVIDACAGLVPDVERFADRSRGERPHLDVAGITRTVLLESGFSADRIHDTEACTRCDGSIFHSYRRSGKGAGRNLAIAAI